MHGGIEVGNASNIELDTNTITPDESDGIRLYGINMSLSINNNIISEPTGATRYVCINNGSDNPDDVVITNNSCN